LFLDDTSTSQEKRKDDRRKKESFRVESESKVIEEELDMAELEEDHRRTEMPTTSIVANHGSSIPFRSVGSFSIPAIITGSLSLSLLLVGNSPRKSTQPENQALFLPPSWIIVFRFHSTS